MLDLRPEEVRIDDIAHCLAHTCRFHGSTRHHYSVAQHSVYVAWLLRRESAQTRLQALLHDASESYLPDLAPQVKRAIPGFRQLEAALWSAVAQRFELPEAKPPLLKEPTWPASGPSWSSCCRRTATRAWRVPLPPWKRRSRPWSVRPELCASENARRAKPVSAFWRTGTGRVRPTSANGSPPAAAKAERGSEKGGRALDGV